MKFPVLPTIVVGLAVAAMVALGVWQLQRREWKEAMLISYAENQNKLATAFPRNPVGHEFLFRRTSAFCLEPVAWAEQAGRTRDGRSGWRHIADCRTGGLEGPALKVLVGVSLKPMAKPAWKGGEVSGVISLAPTGRSALLDMFGGSPPPQLMIVADTAPPGLEPSVLPNPVDVPNNHLAYAVQWFVFAAVALGIYLIALRRRSRGIAPPPAQG